jgi:hypothetical protein
MDYISDYYSVIEKNKTFFDALDIVIYQLSGVDSGMRVGDVPAIIAPYISSRCLKINIPTVAVFGLWSMVYHDDHVVSSAHLKAIVEAGVGLQDLIALYDHGQIDFAFKDRFEKDIKFLKYLERKSDVEISDYIQENVSEKYLFSGQYHPNYGVYVEIIHRIVNFISKSGFNIDIKSLSLVLNSADVIDYAVRTSSGEYLPYDDYSLHYYGFKWATSGGRSRDNSTKYYHFMLRSIVERALPIRPNY